VSNAVKHTGPGTRVRISTRAVQGGIEVVVEDDGPGVGPEVRDLPFRPFTHGSTAPSHAPGVGVGLALVGRFADLHGRRARVEDRPGGGPSFPRLPPSVATSPPTPRPTEGLTASLDGR
jgi:signal transduction histidine kinase